MVVPPRESPTLQIELPIQWHGTTLPLHGIFEALGYAIGYQVYRKLKKSNGDFLSSEWRFQLVIAAILGALIGSKVPGLMDHWLIQGAPRAWFSSKTVVGGLLGGLFAVEMVKSFHGIRRATGDLWTQPVLIGMMIGRVGCFLAGPQDGTWGHETASLFGVNPGSGIFYHPAPLYEIAFLSLVSFGLFHLSKAKPHWNRYRIFLLAYLIFRFGVDFIKTDPILAWNLTSIQWVCLFGVVGLIAQYRRLWDADSAITNQGE